MNNKHYFLIACIAINFFALLKANAEPYIYSFGGFQCENFSDLQHVAPPFFGAAVGYEYSPGISIEAELAYRAQGQIFSGMGNVYYDLPFEYAAVTPYIGAGVGVSNARQSKFAWQSMGGFCYPLSEKVDLNMEYRAFHTARGKIQSHGLLFGLKCKF